MTLTDRFVVSKAWHHPWHYRLLEGALKEASYEVTVCDLPSTGDKQPVKDIWADVDAIKRAVNSYLDRGINVTLVMHSLGGFTGSAAVQGLSIHDRNGLAGITSLVYLCAFVADEGISVLSANGGSHAPFVRSLGQSGWLAADNPPSTPHEIFYSDLPREIQEANVNRLRLFSEGACHTPNPYAAWKHVESNYLICELDQAIPAQMQEMMLGQPGGKWKRVEKMEAAHSPFISKPEETAVFVRRCAGEIL